MIQDALAIVDLDRRTNRIAVRGGSAPTARSCSRWADLYQLEAWGPGVWVTRYHPEEGETLTTPNLPGCGRTFPGADHR